MVTDKIRKYVLPNIPYLFIGWFCLKIGTAYRLAAGAGFGEKLLGLGQTIGAAFASFAPGLAPLDWFVGIVGAVGFRLLIYCKAKKAKKFRRDAEYGTARWGNEKDIKPFVDPKFENNMLLPAPLEDVSPIQYVMQSAPSSLQTELQLLPLQKYSHCRHRYSMPAAQPSI